jgi:hypothetical protein
MAERVDKNWQRTGIENYATEAIFGTLAHYGVRLDVEGFRAQARSGTPAVMAHDWHQDWKGTGQFSSFPYAAANELWRRLEGDRLRPIDLADALGELMVTLQDAIEAEEDGLPAELEAAFAEVEAQVARLPTDKDAHDALMEEVSMQLDEDGSKVFDELAEELARAKKRDLADRFVALEQKLLPERQGITAAVVRAASGQLEAALGELEAAVEDSSRSPQSRLLAVDALIHLDAHEPARAHGERLLDEAEKADDYHLALTLCDRLALLLEKLGRIKELQALADRAERIGKAHDLAHPHHAHRH